MGMKSKTERPNRGDIWLVNLNPAMGHEQAGKRPALVISVDDFNHGPAELVVVLPITSIRKGIPFHIEISPDISGLSKTSYIKCEDIRSVSKERLIKKQGSVSLSVLKEAEDRLEIPLGI